MTISQVLVKETELAVVEVIVPGPTGAVAASAPITYDAGTQTVGISAATTSAAGSMSAADKTKLDGLATVATTGAYSDLSGRPTLGTAAAANTGTSAGNVVVLDGSGRLPAVDGSLLTGISSGGGSGSVTSVGMSVPTGFSVSGSPVTSSGTLAISYASGYSLPSTASQGNWDTAYTDRLKWDGGSTGLNASSARTSLGLGTAATTDANAYATAAQGTDSREWSAATIDQAEAEAGTATTRRAFTAQRVFQAIAAWWAASSAKTKLDGIASGATANSSDATLLARANHTGTQTASTISDFNTVAAAAAPVQSVAGRTGSVTLSSSDISGLGSFATANAATPPAIGGTTPAAGSFTRVSLPAQESTPSTPATGFSFFANSSNALSWVGANGFVRTFDGTANTANRTYTLPDKSGTVALTSDIIGTTNASDLSSGTLADARLSSKVMAAVNVTLWSNFR